MGADPEDPFDALIRREIFERQGPVPHEPSAAERQRAAAEAAGRQRRRPRAPRQPTARRRSIGASRLIIPALIMAVVGAYWFTGRETGLPATLGGETVERPSDYPPADETASAVPLGTPPAAPAEPGASAFLKTQGDGVTPVTWDPCRPIRFVVNPTGAPDGGDEAIREAIERTGSATGLVFADAGETDEFWSDEREPYQPERYGEQWAPLLITWDTAAEVPEFGHDVAGMGGPWMVSDKDGDMVSVSGQIVLSAAHLSDAIAAGNTDAVRAVVQHELGHAVGLDHVDDPEQLMHPSNTGQSDWGTGDLAGLSRLGAGKCYPWV